MKARILVVDDDEALAEMIGIVLRNDGFDPVFCADGGQALDVFRSPETLRIADITIDVAGHTVKRADERISLTPLEFDLLVALARKPWQVFTRELLLEQVWGYRHAADTRLVNVHVQRLRSKIERDPEAPEVVLTVRGVGYKAGS
jgi:two-component system response regulator MtrA